MLESAYAWEPIQGLKGLNHSRNFRFSKKIFHGKLKELAKIVPKSVKLRKIEINYIISIRI